MNKKRKMTRKLLTKKGLWVIKIGSAILTNGGKGLSETLIDSWAAQITALKKSGYQVVLVSSGAIAAGMARLGWQTRPHEIHKQQAAAALGQTSLVQAYENSFENFGVKTAQILLTHDDISNRKRYLNAKSAMETLLDLDVVPIVNENDTVAVDEIRFGDNDSLAALVVNLLDADTLVILTDQEGMYDKNPSEFDDAMLLNEVHAEDEMLDTMASSKGGNLGKGGMYSKLLAARIAARSGANTVISSGVKENVLLDLSKGENIGTLLLSGETSLDARAQWLAGQLQVKGTLVLDDGAVKVLLENGKSLLPIGVKEIAGTFNRGDLVQCVSLDGKKIAHGLMNYNSKDSAKIAGKPSDEIESTLGFVGTPELIHRDNLVLV